MNKQRRIVVRDVTGRLILTDVNGNPTPHYQIDMTGYENSNSQCLYVIEVQETCNLGDWHTIQKHVTNPWQEDF